MSCGGGATCVLSSHVLCALLLDVTINRRGIHPGYYVFVGFVLDCTAVSTGGGKGRMERTPGDGRDTNLGPGKTSNAGGMGGIA